MKPKNEVLDLLGRPISPGDYVVSYNGLYEVIELDDRSRSFPEVRICLVIKNKTTRPVRRLANELCLVPKGDVTLWLLKRTSRPGDE